MLVKCLRYVIAVVFFQSFLCAKIDAQTLNKKSGSLPVPNHIVILIFENHSYSSIIGSTAAPYINALANDSNSAVFTKSYAIEHPSQPNYIDFFSGGNQGVINDNVPATYPFTTPNLARQLIDSGRTFTTYSEDLPSVGYNGASSGYYARKHNPAANWVGSGTNQLPVTVNQPFTAFPSIINFSNLPTVSYVVPNLANDMHNGTDPTTISIGDSWMHTYLNNYILWAKTNNSLLIVTFDEDDNSSSNQIATVFYGQMVKGGHYTNTINHYSILRTIEDMYGLTYAGNASTATPISNCWVAASTAGLASVTNNEYVYHIYPNPVGDIIYFNAKNMINGKGIIQITDGTGKCLQKNILSDATQFSVNTSGLISGIYFYQIIIDDKVVCNGKFVVGK